MGLFDRMQNAFGGGHNPFNFGGWEKLEMPRQPQPGDDPQAEPQKKGGLFSRLSENIDGMDMAQLGLSMMGSAQRGGDWGQVGQDLGQIIQMQRRRKENERRKEMEDIRFEREGEMFGLNKEAFESEQARAEAQEARDSELHGYTLEDHQYVQGNRDRLQATYENAIANAPTPEQAEAIRAAGPQGYAQYLQQQRQNEFAVADREDQQAFLSAQNAANRASQQQIAGARTETNRRLAHEDAVMLAEESRNAAGIRTEGLPQLQAMRKNIIEAAGLDAVGKPLDYQLRIPLGRIFNGSSAERQSLETWKARILGPALEKLRGFGSMSEKEFEGAMDSFSNPNMTVGAAMELIDEQIALAERKVVRAQAMNDYYNEYGGITGVQMPDGGGFVDYLQTRFDEFAPQPVAEPQPADTPKPEPVEPFARGTIRDGHIYMGGDPNDPSSWQEMSQPERKKYARTGRYSGTMR